MAVEIILALIFCTNITISLIALRRRSVPGAVSLIVFGLDLAIFASSFVIIWNQASPFRLAFLSLAYLGLTVASMTVFTFVVEYTNHKAWLTKKNLLLLLLEPVLTQIFFWTNPWLKLFFKGNRLELFGSTLANGPWVWINTIYSDCLMLLSVFLLIQTLSQWSISYQRQSRTILLGTLVPILMNNINFSAQTPIPALDLPLVAFTITGITFTFGFLRDRLLDILPIPRDVVVERMTDGWIVLDSQGRIIDLNPVAEEILGAPRNKIFGLPAETILSNWPNAMNGVNGAREVDFKGSVNLRGGWRYLNLRISPLIDEKQNHFGQLVVWRDITERRVADEARQRARDDMFILLHSISGAASRALNLDDFLAESIYQILYSSKSQSIAVYLLDEIDANSEKPRLTLAAQYGLLDSSVKELSSLSQELAIVSCVLQGDSPLLIPDVSADLRVPESMRALGKSSLLMLPMSIEGHILGLINLTRRDEPVYSSDDIARLTAVAEEVATFIRSNRQRQLSIALTERQRLVRDLHDSVTQKLYGLVTLAEAAQAAMEAGALDMPTQVLSRIGENARQALKEMRLFLHELQPVDLEGEGLASVLHQRLAAVEGRADVKARMLADEDISLSPDKEVALYYIAQEALNNVLRHANAKSVTVHLTQKRINTFLEIEDDGCGFNPAGDHKGGLGLRNMRERAALIGGKLSIVSSPGQGTKISVVVAKDKQQNKPVQKRRRK